VPGIRAQLAPGRNFGQPAEVMGPAFRMASALLGIRQAGVGQAQQRSVRLLASSIDKIYQASTSKV
jgi:5,10-methenyltetrahydromethanopterin hydrogenase